MSKTDLAARPMFHHTRDAIEAHLTIVFTALAVAHAIRSAAAWPPPTSSSNSGRCAQRPSPSTAPVRPSHRESRPPTKYPRRPRHQHGLLSQMS
jgi:hypothetical protein